MWADTSGKGTTAGMEADWAPCYVVPPTEEEQENALTTWEVMSFTPHCGFGVMLAWARLHDHTGCTFRYTMGFVTAICIQLISLAVQLTATFLLYAFPVEAAADPYEVGLHRHRLMVEEVVYGWPQRQLNDSISEEREALDLCLGDHTVKGSQSLLIWVWIVRMVPCLSRALTSFVAVQKLPALQDGSPAHVAYSHQGYERRNQGLAITYMTRRMAWGAFFFLLLPETVCTVLIMGVGAKFLFYAVDLFTIITKTVGLWILTELDTVVFKGLTSHTFQEQVTNSAFKWREPKPRSSLRRASRHWDYWGSSLFRLVAVTVIVLFYTRWHNAELQALRGACMDYKELFHPQCGNCGLVFLGHHLYPP